LYQYTKNLLIIFGLGFSNKQLFVNNLFRKYKKYKILDLARTYEENNLYKSKNYKKPAALIID